MSDLQCPATLVLVAARPGEPGALAELLADRHVALVYADGTEGSVTAGSVLAQRLGVVCRHAPDLQSVADLHRGETVVVVGDTAASRFRLPVEVSVDGDGFSPQGWPAGP